MIPQSRNQYDPMASMMQVLQLAMQQNQHAAGMGLENRQLDLRQRQFEQQMQQQQQHQTAQMQAQEQERQQRQQQTVMEALMRSMPQNEMGVEDPSLLHNYLRQIGVQLPDFAQMRTPVNPEELQARAMMSQLSQ